MTAGQFWIYTISVLLAPLIALQVSEILQKRKEARSRRLWIFKTLMATRASRLNFEHVQALNMIDIEFHGNGAKDKAVLESWKAYLNHFNTRGLSPENWVTRGDDLFIDLLHAMSRRLGYGFEKTAIRSTSYFPEAHGRLEADQAAIRAGLAEVLQGKRAIPIAPLDQTNRPGA